MLVGGYIPRSGRRWDSIAECGAERSRGGEKAASQSTYFRISNQRLLETRAARKAPPLW